MPLRALGLMLALQITPADICLPLLGLYFQLSFLLNQGFLYFLTESCLYISTGLPKDNLLSIKSLLSG